MLEEEKKVNKTPQQYKQKKVVKKDTYPEALEAYNDMKDVERKRIRRRPAGHFDVIAYEKINKEK